VMRDTGLGITNKDLATIPTAALSPAPTPGTIVDCGSDMECFKNAVSRGSESTMLWSQSLNLFPLFGAVINSTSQLDQKRDGNKGKYVYVQTTLDVSYSLPEELMQILTADKLAAEKSRDIDNFFISLGYESNPGSAESLVAEYGNKSRQEIQEAMNDQYREVAESVRGTVHKCWYDNHADLVPVLTRWQSGEFSTGDFNFAYCETTSAQGAKTITDHGVIKLELEIILDSTQ